MGKLSRTVQWCCGAFFMVLGLRVLWSAIDSHGNITAAAAVVVLLSLLAYGLVKQYRWALRSSAFLFLLSAIVIPVGLFNPFTAGDLLLAGRYHLHRGLTLLWLIPLEIVLLALIFLLDPKKRG